MVLSLDLGLVKLQPKKSLLLRNPSQITQTLEESFPEGKMTQASTQWGNGEAKKTEKVTSHSTNTQFDENKFEKITKGNNKTKEF